VAALGGDDAGSFEDVGVEADDRGEGGVEARVFRSAPRAVGRLKGRTVTDIGKVSS
jgi:hypothetical protein